MYEAIIFLTEGFEEIEAVTVIDVLRRGGCIAASVSLTGAQYVAGAQNIIVKADMTFTSFIRNAAWSSETVIVLPGGRGTVNYKTNKPFLDLLVRHHEAGGRIAAICAAPSVLGMLGLLENKTAVCYPGFENELTGARIGSNDVETDGPIVTSKGPATSLAFAFEVLKQIKGTEVMEQVKGRMVV